jgi:hypothetical protein
LSLALSPDNPAHSVALTRGTRQMLIAVMVFAIATERKS